MHTIQKPQKTSGTSGKTGEKKSWVYWKLVSEAGRQRWIFHPPEEVRGLDQSSSGYEAFLKAMASDFIFQKEKNPHASDRVYTESRSEKQDMEEGYGLFKKWHENPLLYPSSLSMRSAGSAFKGIRYLDRMQLNDGHWPGDYGGPLFLLPALVFAAYITSEIIPEEKKVLMIRYMQNHQNPDGGWGLHIEGNSTMFGTVMQYCALRILGLEADTEELQRGRAWILDHGDARYLPSWGKFFLALLNVYSWDGCHSLLPEMWLLPRWLPFHPGRYWCHARMVYLPMSYCYGHRIQAAQNALIMSLRQELYHEDYDRISWRRYCNKVADTDLYRPISAGLKFVFKALNLYEKQPFKIRRKSALRFILEYIHAEDQHTAYIDIGPVNQIINSVCLWHACGAGSDAFRKHVDRWDDYLWLAEDGMKMSGYNGSQLWDTAFTVQAMLENPDSGASSHVLSRAYDFIEKMQVRDEVTGRHTFFRHPSVGGWPFSTRDHGWPISDCTAEGLKAVLKLHRAGISSYEKQIHIADVRLQKAVDLILTLQNKDGGWGTYENQRSGSWLEILNPSDIFGKIMVDYSWVECTSACITALVEFQSDYPGYRSEEIRKAIVKGLRFIRREQRDDGSWIGSWGICFTYGTWFALEAISRARAYQDDVRHMQYACDFLVSKQRPDGGWGESWTSCSRGEYIEHKRSQVVQTSWALLALMAAQYHDKQVVDRGISFLTEHQLPTGEWPQEGISGVFNKTCMITYSSYRNIFPVWALERYSGSYSRYFRNGASKSWKITNRYNNLSEL